MILHNKTSSSFDSVFEAKFFEWFPILFPFYSFSFLFLVIVIGPVDMFESEKVPVFIRSLFYGMCGQIIDLFRGK